MHQFDPIWIVLWEIIKTSHVQIFLFFSIMERIRKGSDLPKKKVAVTEHPTKIFAHQVNARVISSIFCWVFDLVHALENDVARKATTKISNEFYQRGLTIINFLCISVTRSIKTRKKMANFSSFNPFPSMPSVETGHRKQFQYLQIVFNKKTRSWVLEFNWCEDTF